MTLRDSATRIGRAGMVVTWVALAGLAAVYVRALEYTPVEVNQGAAQKIFYVHVPAAWSALLAISITGLLSMLYLWLKDRRIDLAAAASTEVGDAFAKVMINTSPN